MRNYFLLILLALPAVAQKRPAAHPPKSGATDAAFQDLSKKAAEARDADKIDEAIELYKKSLKLRPKWEEGWWYVGTLYYDSDRYAEALPAFRTLVELNQKTGPAYALLGLCEFETGDYKNSLLHLEHARALGLAGNEELVNVTRYHEALLLNLKGEFEAAMEVLSSLVGRGVSSENVKVAMGLTLLRVPLLPKQVDPSKDALIHEAGEIGELTALSDFDRADAAFQKMLREYADTPFLHYAYASMLTILTRFEEAEKQLEEEMKITPESALPYMQLAYIYLRVNRSQDALAPARQAVKLAPHNFAAYYLLGRALLEQGNIAESIHELETARRLGPFSPEVHYNLARAYAKVGRQNEAADARKEFARLNAVLERRQKQKGPQSYRSASDRGGVPPSSSLEAGAPEH